MLKITLSYQEGSVELTVEDNGSGFDYSPASTGFGILGMQKRASNVGSALEIFSTPGKGTQIRVKANLQQVRLRNRMLSIVKSRLRNFVSHAANR